jgi:hypothetical protein
MDEKSLAEIKLEALESYTPMYHMIALAAKGIIPIDSLPPELIRSLLHYVAGDICLYEGIKRQAREKN